MSNKKEKKFLECFRKRLIYNFTQTRKIYTYIKLNKLGRHMHV